MLFARKIIDFHSFLIVTLHFIVPGPIEIIAVEPGPHNITVIWNTTNADETCIVVYSIVWEDGSRLGCGNTTNNYFVIDSLGACVTYDVTVNVSCVYSGAETKHVPNVTTLPAGKWHDSWLLHTLILTLRAHNILNNCSSYYKYRVFKPYQLHLQGAIQVH